MSFPHTSNTSEKLSVPALRLEREITLFLPKLSLTGNERFFLNPPSNPYFLKRTTSESVCKENTKCDLLILFCLCEAGHNFESLFSLIKHFKSDIFNGKLLCTHKVKKKKSNGAKH